MNKTLQLNRPWRILAALLLGAAALAVQAQTSSTATQSLAVHRPASQSPMTATTPTAATTSAQSGLPAGADQLRFNFQGVSLDAVLDYMSQSAGFIINREATVTGRVDVVSHQPLTRDEAVALLDTVLNAKGFAAIRQGRTLTIVSRTDARYKPIPVITGNDPEKIPASDKMVTQIIPVRHANAKALLDDLKGLLPEWATVSANEASNAIVLTDTQVNIRRIVEIVVALDQSITSISTVKVYPLKYADAKEAATLIKDMFTTQQSSGQSQSGRGGMMQQLMRMRGGPFGGGPGGDSGDSSSSSSSGDSAALQASARITAVADSRTNSLVVSAPDELIPTITQLITTLDRSTEVLTVVRVFPLENADATEMATVLTNIFGSGGQTGVTQTSSSRRSSTRSSSTTARGGFSGPFGPMMGPFGASSTTSDLSERKLAENTVVATADTRTNAIIVSAVSEVMDQVAKVVAQLDQSPAKTKKVFVYSLKNADAESVGTILQGMFGSSSSSGTSTKSSTSSKTSSKTSSSSNSNSSSRSGSNSSNSSFGSGF